MPLFASLVPERTGAPLAVSSAVPPRAIDVAACAAPMVITYCPMGSVWPFSCAVYPPPPPRDVLMSAGEPPPPQAQMSAFFSLPPEMESVPEPVKE